MSGRADVPTEERTCGFFSVMFSGAKTAAQGTRTHQELLKTAKHQKLPGSTMQSLSLKKSVHSAVVFFSSTFCSTSFASMPSGVLQTRTHARPSSVNGELAHACKPELQELLRNQFLDAERLAERLPELGLQRANLGESKASRR